MVVESCVVVAAADAGDHTLGEDDYVRATLHRQEIVEERDARGDADAAMEREVAAARAAHEGDVEELAEADYQDALERTEKVRLAVKGEWGPYTLQETWYQSLLPECVEHTLPEIATLERENRRFVPDRKSSAPLRFRGRNYLHYVPK